MTTICDADLHHLKPGKRVVLKSFNGSLIALQDVKLEENYWLLIGCKAVVVQIDVNAGRALITFAADLQKSGLVCHNGLENSVWVLISDLKFVCRY